MTTRKRSKDDDEEFDDEPIAKRIAAAAAMDPDPARPSSFEDQAHWNRMFFELMLYRANYGNVNVKSTDEKYAELYRWIVQLRKDYKTRERNPEESPLTADQIKTLESVRFAFTTRGEEHWQKNYEKLQEYKKEHGHVLVPRQCEIPGLGDWVTSQRQQYQEYVQGKPTPLTKQRKDLLDDIGFQWRVRNRPEWQSKFAELEKYKEKHGDTRVPQHYSENRALGKWVAKQREQFKLLKKSRHSFLTPDRLEKLNSIGFVWSVRGETIDDGLMPETFSPKKEEKDEVKEEIMDEMKEEKDELKEEKEELEEEKEEIKEENDEVKEEKNEMKEESDELKEDKDELKEEPIENSVSI